MAVEIIDLEFEKLLKKAITRELKREINTTSSEEFFPSLNFQKQMKELFKKDKRENFLKNFIRYSKRAAMYILIILGIFTALFVVSEDVRAKVEIIIEWFEDYTKFKFDGNEIRKNDNDIDISIISNNYTIIYHEDLGAVIVIEFLDSNQNRIDFSYTTIDTAASYGFDNERHEIEHGKILDYDAVFMIGDSESEGHGILWTVGDFRLNLFGYVPMEELIFIAEELSK